MTHQMTVTVKEPEEIEALCDHFDIDKNTYNEYFEFGEYVTIVFEVDEALRITGGRLVPISEL